MQWYKYYLLKVLLYSEYSKAIDQSAFLCWKIKFHDRGTKVISKKYLYTENVKSCLPCVSTREFIRCSPLLDSKQLWPIGTCKRSHDSFWTNQETAKSSYSSQRGKVRAETEEAARNIFIKTCNKRLLKTKMVGIQSQNSAYIHYSLQ